MLQVILNTGLQSQSTLLYPAFILHFGEVHLLLPSFVTTIFAIGHLFSSDSSFLLTKYHWLYNYILANFIFVGSEVSGVLPFSTNPKIYLKCARPSSNSYKSRYQPLKILLMVASLLSIFFCLIRIHSMQGWTVTLRHGVTRKRSTKRLRHTGNLFRKNLQLKDVY